VSTFTESVVEEAALAWLEGLGYTILHGPEIAPGEPFAERENYGQVILEGRLRQALQRLNPQVPADALDEAFRRLTRRGLTFAATGSWPKANWVAIFSTASSAVAPSRRNSACITALATASCALASAAPARIGSTVLCWASRSCTARWAAHFWSTRSNICSSTVWLESR
jgi:hypothetical protein